MSLRHDALGRLRSHVAMHGACQEALQEAVTGGVLGKCASFVSAPVRPSASRAVDRRQFEKEWFDETVLPRIEVDRLFTQYKDLHRDAAQRENVLMAALATHFAETLTARPLRDGEHAAVMQLVLEPLVRMRAAINVAFCNAGAASRGGSGAGRRVPIMVVDTTTAQKNKNTKKRKTPTPSHEAAAPPAPQRRAGTFKASVTALFTKWLYEHMKAPYPDDEQKRALARQTGKQPKQVNYWFINARVRVWRPLISRIMLRLREKKEADDAAASDVAGQPVEVRNWALVQSRAGELVDRDDKEPTPRALAAGLMHDFLALIKNNRDITRSDRAWQRWLNETEREIRAVLGPGCSQVFVDSLADPPAAVPAPKKRKAAVSSSDDDDDDDSDVTMSEASDSDKAVKGKGNKSKGATRKGKQGNQGKSKSAKGATNKSAKKGKSKSAKGRKPGGKNSKTTRSNNSKTAAAGSKRRR